MSRARFTREGLQIIGETVPPAKRNKDILHSWSWTSRDEATKWLSTQANEKYLTIIMSYFDRLAPTDIVVQEPVFTITLTTSPPRLWF